jgi:hypothetical protein
MRRDISALTARNYPEGRFFIARHPSGIRLPACWFCTTRWNLRTNTILKEKSLIPDFLAIFFLTRMLHYHS